ncbi:hypothetical protein PMAYCL1PPCAC_11669, partial [Pristionchus mayeri]
CNSILFQLRKLSLQVLRMDSDFDDKEDDKSYVRSALDALGDSMGRGGKRRGRPRKYPKASTSSVSSSHKRSPSPVKSDSDEGASDGGATKRRKRGSDEDDDWDEETEALSISQRREMRTRKRPALFSEESFSSNSAKRKQPMGKRKVAMGSGGPARFKAYTGPDRPYPITYNKPAALMETKLTKEEKAQHEKWRQQWRDIEHPMQAKLRIFPDLRKGLFEKCLEQIAPIPGAEPASSTIPESISSIFGKITCSAGFTEFLKNVNLAACVAIYDICDKLFVLSEDMPDNMQIAQALRFWWNSLSFATRRKWEQHARSAVYNDRNTAKPVDDRAATDGNEVPIRNVTAKRLLEEEKWEDMRAERLSLLDEIDTVVSCPLCEKDEAAEPCKLATIKDMQEHFFHYHWQVHGYACHFCGTMFCTPDELMSGHSDCEDWVAWNASRILTGPTTGKLLMTCCRMLLCCSDCGWYKPLSRRDWNANEEATMSYLKTFFSNHNNDGLLTMIVYFPGKPTHEVSSIRFAVTSMAGGDPQAPCVHCGPEVTFRDPMTANEHYAKEHKDMALVCEVCDAKTTTEYLLKQHQMCHIHDNSSYFADYLTNTARIFPPPTNLSCAPRSGWKLRTKGDNIAVGGLIGGVPANSGLDLVEPMEDVSEMKARLIRKRKKDGLPTIDKGYENPELEEESSMARKIREKLMNKYGEYEGMGAFDDPTWLRDSEAIKFREWMEYWESAEGKKLGGPPREIEVDLTPSIVRIPTVDVELLLQDMDILSGFLLNDNVFYCCECDSILKGEQAYDHLKMKGPDGSPNKCAMDEGELEENPILNENMFQLYSFAAAPSDHCLPCPHCAFWLCSITGLRVHIMTVHGIFVKYQRVPNESVTNVVALKFDIRTRLAKKIDAKLGMLPSGMLAQRRPQVSDVNVLDKSWPAILLTRENCPIVLYKSLQQFVELERQQQAQPRVILAPPRGGFTQVQGHRPPFRTDTTNFNRSAPQVRYTSLEQSLQMQQQRMQPQNRMMGNSTPLGRPLHTVSRAMNHPSPLVNRIPVEPKRLVRQSHVEGGKVYLTCQVCTTNTTSYEQELLKAHLLRCHFHTCGHCTAIFVFEEEAKRHARGCRITRNNQLHHPDPRLPHVKTRCPYCSVAFPMVDMHMHLMDFHLAALEFDGTGRLMTTMRMMDVAPAVGKEPEVERLRFKYYVPPKEVAEKRGYVQCYACGLMLPDQGKLQIHLKLHPEFMYFCWLCPRLSSASLGQVPAIVNHIKTKHCQARETRPGFVPCPHCNLNMFNRQLQHLMYECEHNNICQLCRDLPAFENAAELREHREKCHYNALRRFECSQCTGYFSTTHDFSAHVCDPSAMKTTCTGCKPPADFKTRQQFLAHFKATHVRGDGVCKICCIKFKSNEEQTKHWFGHAKNDNSAELRTMLLCAYGELNNEMRALFTHVSNASFRLKGRQEFHGGTEDSPVCLSDDDDIIEVPSAAVQQERREAAAAAAYVPLHASSPPSASNGRPRRTSCATPVASDETEVLEVMKKMLNTVVNREAEAKNGFGSAMEEEEERNNEMPMELANLVEAEDDDIMMVEDVPVVTDRTLSASVRVEAEDTTAVGGQNQPGYKEDEDEPMDAPIQPVVREFTPEDEELCVVAEVDNPGCSTAAATISKGRAKKYACSKCSDKFITQARLTNHLQSAHQFDAGQSTIMEELGMPLNHPVWVCKSCCLCFQTEQQKKAHNSQHGQQTYRCESCAGCAYNIEVMNQHHRRIQERKISYVCGECKLEFESDTALHEHSNLRHGVPLLFFCKFCEMGSTDGVATYRHFLEGCQTDVHRRNRSRKHEEAIKCIGVVPACQLHFQPVSLDEYKEAHGRNPNLFVVPSICNHRSMIVAVEKLVSCNDCKCLDSMQRHLACLPEEVAKQFDASMRPVRGSQPLLVLRNIIDKEKCRQDTVARHVPGPSMQQLQHRYVNANAAPLPVTARYQAVSHQPVNHQSMPVLTSHATPRFEEAQRRQNDRMQAAMLARTGGGGMGVPGRGPVVTPGTAARHFPQGLYRSGGGGGPAILRGSPMPSARPPVMTRAPLSTMGSLQAIAAVAGGSHGLQQSASSSVVSSQAASPAAGQCQVCSCYLFTQRDVFLHSLHTPDRGAFVCARCPIAMNDEKAAIKHIINHMESGNRATEMDMECPICRKSAPTMSGLRQHLTQHNPPLSHPVQGGCSLTFGSAALAKAHEDAHKASGHSECCVLCGTVDNWTDEMVDNRGKGLVINHHMKHACKHVYYCKICDMKQFQEENQMITHFMMTHTSVEGDSWSCNECSEMLATENDHKIHCIAKHTITEMHVPERMSIKVPQTFNDYLGVEPLQ